MGAVVACFPPISQIAASESAPARHACLAHGPPPYSETRDHRVCGDGVDAHACVTVRSQSAVLRTVAPTRGWQKKRSHLPAGAGVPARFGPTAIRVAGLLDGCDDSMLGGSRHKHRNRGDARSHPRLQLWTTDNCGDPP